MTFMCINKSQMIKIPVILNWTVKILYKLGPVIDLLNARFRTLALQKNFTVHVILCATRARYHLKQYLPANISIQVVKIHLCHMNRTGASRNIVVRLCQNVPCFQNYRVHFDNFYTFVPLLFHQAQKGIHSLETFRKVKIPYYKLLTKEINEM